MQQWIQAGRELDASVAQYVMGAVPVRDLNEGSRWHWLEGTVPGWRFPNGRAFASDEGLPLYSSDTCATWEVVMSLMASGWEVCVEPSYRDNAGDAWMVRMHHRVMGVTITESGRTAPLAVCLAALRAVAESLDTAHGAAPVMAGRD